MKTAKKTKRNDKVALGGYIAASVILFLMLGLIPDRDIAIVTAHAEQSNAELEMLALESCRSISVYDVAEVQISILRSLRRAIIRSIFPDGWVEAWLRCLGNVRAGVNLSYLTRNDLQISIDAAGNRHAVLRLPAPEITSTVLNDEGWGRVNNFWVLAPDRMAIEIRQQLRHEMYSELEERALESGLLEQARSNVAEAASEVFSALNVQSVDVILDDDRILEFGCSSGRAFNHD